MKIKEVIEKLKEMNPEHSLVMQSEGRILRIVDDFRITETWAGPAVKIECNNKTVGVWL